MLVSVGLHPTQADVMVKTEGADPFVEPELRLKSNIVNYLLPTDFGEEPEELIDAAAINDAYMDFGSE